MKQLFIKIAVFFLVSTCFINVTVAKSKMSVTGYWTTIDDKTRKPRALVKIYKSSRGVLSARIIKVLNKQAGDKGICTKCPGKLKNRPIKRMRFLWSMKPAGNNKWAGGKILDPKSGKIYRCKMSLESARKLNVRGFIGISLFGRTQNWVR